MHKFGSNNHFKKHEHFNKNRTDKSEKYNKSEKYIPNDKFKPKFENKFEKLADSDLDSDNEDTNPSYKSYVLDFLYNKIEINEHKYTIIKNVGDIYDLKNKKFYSSINSCGINSFIVFIKKDNSYYSFVIDRRSISYNRQSLKKEAVRLTEVNLSVDLKFYDGTIIDGVLIDNDSNIISNKSLKNKPKYQFMVSDVFMLAGKSLITMDYKKKMYYVNNMFDKYIEKNNKTNNIDFYVSRPYELNQMPALFRDYLGPNVKNFNIKGITFYPQFSGSKIIYIFDKQDDKYKNELVNGDAKIEVNNDDNIQLLDISDKKKIFKFELINPECIDDIILNLEMRKTTTPDVYKLFGIFCNKSTSSEVTYIKKKIGIAYIPTYILSLKCKSYFLNSDVVIMSCKFNPNKNKWIPVDEAEVQKIDILNDEKRLKITELEVLDNDVDINEEE